MEEINEYRRSLEWYAVPAFYYAQSNDDPDNILWHCCFCGDGTDHQTGKGGSKGAMQAHMATCPREPQSEQAKADVDFMMEHERAPDLAERF